MLPKVTSTHTRLHQLETAVEQRERKIRDGREREKDWEQDRELDRDHEKGCSADGCGKKKAGGSQVTFSGVEEEKNSRLAEESEEVENNIGYFEP